MYLIIIFILVILLYSIFHTKEKFTAANKPLLIKKTNTYNSVYRGTGFYVWEAEPIDNYFPVGQKITLDNHPPKEMDILVLSQSRITDFTLISMTDNGYGVWRPLCNNGYGSLTDIFSKNKPSKNRIKLIPKKYLRRTTISNIKSNYDSNTTKGFNLWNIHNNPYFFASDLTNTKNNKGELYTINESLTGIETKIMLKNTQKFKKIYSPESNNYAIWRPLPPKHYKILGDIVTKGKFNPNNNIYIPTVYKSYVKPIIDYHDIPVANIKTNDKPISLWRARCSKGYAVLGNVVSFDNNEPLPNEIYSVPMEFLKLNAMGNIEGVADSMPDTENKYSLWANNHFCIANGDYDMPSKETLLQLNMDNCEYERDVMDITKEIQLSVDSTNDIILDDTTTAMIRESLSQRTGVPEYRFKNLEFIDNKIKIDIESKPADSSQNTIDEIIETLVFMISKKNLAFQNDVITIRVSDLHTNHQEVKEKININNGDYLSRTI
jgi:hypothetical protein